MADCTSTELYLPAFASSYYSETLSGSCSGQGTCVGGVLCQCDDGWTGRSDFINTENLTCDINEVAIKVLWAINIVFTVVTVFRVRDSIVAKRQQHLELVKSKEQAGKVYKLRHNRGYAAILTFCLVCAPATVAIGLLRIIKDDERVGITAGMTILFSLAKVGFYVTAYLFQPALLATILKGSRSSKSLVRIADSWGLFNMFLSIGLGFLPFITLLASDTGFDSVAQSVYVAYMAGSVLSMIVFGSQAFIIEHRFNKIMGNNEMTSKSERSAEIRKKLLEFQRSTKTQASVQGLIYATFLFFPFLYNKHDYFLPISWLAFGALFKKLATSTITTRKIGQSTTDGNSRTGSKTGSKEGSLSFQNKMSSVQNTFTRTGGVGASVISNFQEKAVSFHEAPLESEGEEYV